LTAPADFPYLGLSGTGAISPPVSLWGVGGVCGRTVMSQSHKVGCASARGVVWLQRVALAVVLAGWSMAGLAPEAMARHRHHSHHRAAEPAGPPVVFEALTLDADTGQVLSEANADALTYPASLTKMMTLYLTFEALKNGRLRLDQLLPVSAYAASMQPSHLGLSAGDSVSVRDCILGIVTKSANDAAVVLAEALAGSEPAFALQMTDKARRLGMSRTVYRNASGLPNPQQQTTARDIAKLALALLRDFPRDYHYFSTREFEFRGEVLTTHNHMLETYPGADGIKTGFINASGFNIAVSAVRNGHRLIGVLMGGRSWRSRDEEMAALLDRDFARLAAAPAPQIAAVAHPAPPPAAPPPAAPAPVAAAPDPIGRLAAGAVHEAAPRETAPPHREPEDWGIQVGAFRGEKAATRAARHASRLAARGKPEVIVPPSKHDRPPLYRARLAHFTEKGAETACAALHRHRVACTVVPPGARRVASAGR